MFDFGMVYNIIYALAARDGRDAVLFGKCAPLAHEAFVRSCAGNAFPELWFELPLMGEPWFDLHALTSRESLDSDTHFEAGDTGGYPELFAWFASATHVRQLALSYDVRTGDIDHPAIQLLVSDMCMHEPFLELAGGPDAVAAYRALARRLPQDWFACYTGVFPGRAHAGVRVECIPRPELQCAYAEDAALLESHLRQLGMANVGDTVVSRCQLLARMPFQLEFQLDVFPDGTLGNTLGASARFGNPSADDDNQPFDTTGPAGELMEQLERWGLSDDRWHLLADTSFAKRIANDEGDLGVLCYPVFVKLRWREGEPLDAKAYLAAFSA